MLVNTKTTTIRAAMAWPEEPYKGLNYFIAADAPLFAEREMEIEECAARIDDMFTRVLLLHGLSGVGKSSFLRAGLIPRLEAPPLDAGRFFVPADGNGHRLIIRAMDDPISRIHTALRDVVSHDPRIPKAARDQLAQFLAEPLDLDREQAAEAILAALERLCADLRDPLLLVIDQAEEVLTLPQQLKNGPYNRRVGFFNLLEQICLQRSRTRAVISFRTEYYGQLCSFFRIPSTMKITSDVLPRVGLVDYLLCGINDPERLAAAILRPTMRTKVPDFEQLSPPFEKYRFEYAPDLADTVSRDLIAHSHDASALPLMQIVCRNLYERTRARGHGAVISLADYRIIGGVAGAIDAHVDLAIRGALREAGRHRVSAKEMDCWRMTLSSLVGRQESGTVTTLIGTETELASTARGNGIRGNIDHALKALTQDRWRILRLVMGSSGAENSYTLGHDIVGPPLSRWREKHGARLEAERRLRRQVIPFGAAAILVVLALMLQLGVAHNRSAAVLYGIAKQQDSTELRHRLLMLVALQQRAWLPIVDWGHRNEALAELRETIRRSPTFGGQFPAGLNADGTQLARFDKGHLITRDLPTDADQLSEQVDLPASEELRRRAQLVVGLVRVDGPGGRDEPALLEGTRVVKFGPLMSSPSTIPQLNLPQEFRGGAPFQSSAEIVGGALRIQRWSNTDGLLNKISVLRSEATPDQGFTVIQRADYQLDWDPKSHAAWRLPVLADDCPWFAFLGLGSPRPAQEEGQIAARAPLLWLGAFDGHSRSAPPLPTANDPNSQGQASVAIARGCRMAVVRDHWSAADKQGELLFLRLNNDEGSPSAEPARKLSLRGEETKFLPSPFPQVQSPLAAAPLPNGLWRVAWLSKRGLELVDADLAQDKVTYPFSGTEQGHVITLPLFSGLDSTASMVRLSLSKSGDFLFVAQQHNFRTGSPDVRVFDLRASPASLSDDDLITRACQIAAFLPGTSQLTQQELLQWLGDANAAQPCAEP